MFNANRIFAFLSVAALAGCSGNINDGSVLQTVTVLVSLANEETQGNDDSSESSISGDGRYIAFVSRATDLIPGNTMAGVAHVYVRDMLSRTTTLVDIPAVVDPLLISEDSGSPSISGDGRFIVFESDETGLLGTGATDASRKHVFLRDLFLGTTTLVSTNFSGGEGGNAGTGRTSRDPEISSDGRFVTYESDMEDLISGFVDNNGNDTVNPNYPAGSTVGFDIYRFDTSSGTTKLISFTTSPSGGNGTSLNPSVADDGDLIVFQTDASDLFAGDLGGFTDIVITSVQFGTKALVSKSSQGQANGSSANPAISGRGNVIAFQSVGTNLDPKDILTDADIYVRDLGAGTTSIMTVHSHGNQAGNDCNYPSLDNSGRYVVYQSSSGALVTEDSNGVHDIFLRDEINKVTIRVSVATFGGEINSGHSHRPDISSDGRYVSFQSNGTDVVDNDVNSRDDIFRRGPLLP